MWIELAEQCEPTWRGISIAMQLSYESVSLSVYPSLSLSFLHPPNCSSIIYQSMSFAINHNKYTGTCNKYTFKNMNWPIQIIHKLKHSWLVIHVDVVFLAFKFCLLRTV